MKTRPLAPSLFRSNSGGGFDASSNQAWNTIGPAATPNPPPAPGGRRF